MTREKVKSFPDDIPRADVSRFVFFRRGDRPAGVWLFRNGHLYFTLPITTGTKPGVADYLPAPHGLPAFANPVEQVYPALVPFLELADGRTIVATDGADEIIPAANGKSLKAVWRRWAVTGRKAGELVESHLTSEVTWSVEGNTLVRDETLTAGSETAIKRWWVAVTGTGGKLTVDTKGGQRLDNISGEDEKLSISVTADWPLNIYSMAPGDGALGRGARKPILNHVIYEAAPMHMDAGQTLHWRMSLTVM